MSDQPTQHPQVYGFVPKRRHFVWQPSPEPEPVAPPEPDQPPEQAPPPDLVDTVREIASLNPRVAQAMLQVLESEQNEQNSESTEPLRAQLPDPPDPAEAQSEPPPSHNRKKPRRRRRKKSSAADRPSSPLELHQRYCGICGTECQEEIDDAFVSWESVDTIARSFGIRRRAVYRHAHALDLFAQRDRNIRRGLGLIIHRADKVRDVSAADVIRAVKTLAQINDRGQWTPPPTHVIVSSGSPRIPPGQASPETALLDTPARQHPELTP
jgi:hypothetical protein